MGNARAVGQVCEAGLEGLARRERERVSQEGGESPIRVPGLEFGAVEAKEEAGVRDRRERPALTYGQGLAGVEF